MREGQGGKKARFEAGPTESLLSEGGGKRFSMNQPSRTKDSLPPGYLRKEKKHIKEEGKGPCKAGERRRGS